jgi:hypothetical protein
MNQNLDISTFPSLNLFRFEYLYDKDLKHMTMLEMFGFEEIYILL